MSTFVIQGPGSRLGFLAPPKDRPFASATPTTLRHCQRRPFILTTKGPPTCATAALRRRPSNNDSNSSTGASNSATSSRLASRLYELDREGGYTTPAPVSQPASSDSTDANAGLLDDGWGVVAVAPAAAIPSAKREKKKQKRAANAASTTLREPRIGTPFMDKSSEGGIMGLTLLQQRLIEEGREVHSADQKARVAAEAEMRRERLALSAPRKRDWIHPDDLDGGEDEAEEVTDEMFAERQEQQYFELNLDADGSAEVVEFDERGQAAVRRAPGAVPACRSPAAGDEYDDDPLAFLADLDADADEESGHLEGQRQRRAASGATAGPSQPSEAANRRQLAKGTPARGAGVHGRPAVYGNDAGVGDDRASRGGPAVMPGRHALADEEVEWGLDELRAPVGQRPSLLQELGVIKKGRKGAEAAAGGKMKDARGETGPAAKDLKSSGRARQGTSGPSGGDDTDVERDDEMYIDRDLGVAWGGSGGATGIDMEEQEALLMRIYKPHKVKQLMAHQRAAEAELAALKKRSTGRQGLENRIDSRMRILGGTAAGRQLVASQGNTTRPMMQKVREAVFNMLQAQARSGNALPSTARWLDCFAGTGSVGLEALSRGCRECHFIELDPWVCRKVLSRNIATCGFQRQAVVHTIKAEDFLRRAINLPRFACGAFDFISVCPPYLLVSYPELFDLLERSPLLHPGSLVLVEYPKQLVHQVPPTLGPLVTVRDRKYGRTYIRVYGPEGGPSDDEDDEGEALGDGEEEEDEEMLL